MLSVRISARLRVSGMVVRLPALSSMIMTAAVRALDVFIVPGRAAVVAAALIVVAPGRTAMVAAALVMVAPGRTPMVACPPVSIPVARVVVAITVARPIIPAAVPITGTLVIPQVLAVALGALFIPMKPAFVIL